MKRPNWARDSLLAVSILLLAACSGPGSPSSTPPSVASVDAGVKCPSGDHGLRERQLGWSFCYPGTWKFRERVQQSPAPVGVDDTFDIVDVPPNPSPEQGKFGFVIIGTYVRGDSPDLATWVRRYVGEEVVLERISWGNAKEAAVVSGSQRRYALTPNHVVMLDPRAGNGNLDVATLMVQRLDTWRFDY